MANTGYSSPFPTSHDTIGASTLITPFNMPSSPPTPARQAPESQSHSPLGSPVPQSPTLDRLAKRDAEYSDDDDDDEEEEEEKKDRDVARQREIDSPVLSRASSPDRAAMADLDARLAEYSIDFRRLGGDKDDDMLPDMKRFADEDKVSEVGGPEDFTANLEKYLMGDDDDEERLERGPEEQRVQEQEDDQEENEEKEHTREQEQNSKLQSAENEAELGEYSEFGPPVDMSTPSHLLHRTQSGIAKDVTHMEGIEEDDEMEPAVTPSVRKQRQRSLSSRFEEEKTKDLHQQLADLRQALQDRDEQLEKNHNRVREAASAGEQIRHLQAELQRKTTLLDELQEQRSDEELLREQVQFLQKQNQDREMSFRNSMNSTDIGGLRRQMENMQKEMQSQNTSGLDTERMETIAHLRQQLSLSQDQLKKRDATLDETMAKLREVATGKEQQLREKNTEIDSLRAQIDDQALEIEKLETDVDRANTDYQILESRIASLETQNAPLEERNSTLEADLTRAQSQVTAQENALKVMAADLPTGTGGQKTFTEILDLIKDLDPQEEEESEPFLPGVKSSSTRDYELEYLRQEIARLQSEINEKSQSEKTLQAELAQSHEKATETQSLFKSIEAENIRLSKRADDLKSNFDRVQRELQQLKTDHYSALQTIDRLQQGDSTFQQPSPPPSPPGPHTQNANTQTAQTIAALQASHKTQLRTLQNNLSAAEKRESRLRSDLQSLRTNTSTSTASIQHQDPRLDTLTSEVERLQSVIAAKDETAAAMDAKIARSVEKREKEWERRVELLLRERERMGKALLWTWGEKEVGNEVKENVYAEEGGKVRQGYRYKYANPSGNGSKSAKASARRG